jgi:alpha-D-xyloside xylohydrolase
MCSLGRKRQLRILDQYQLTVVDVPSILLGVVDNLSQVRAHLGPFSKRFAVRHNTKSELGGMFLWWLLALVASAAACSQSDRTSDTDVADGRETGGLPDQGGDLNVVDASGPEINEGSVTVGETQVGLRFAPFQLKVDRGSQAVTRSYAGTEAGYGGLEVGIATELDAARWYNPTLGQDDIGDVVRWYRAEEVRSSRRDGEAFVFDVATTAEDGTRGPDIQVRLEAREHSALVRVSCADPGHVFTNLVMELSEGEGIYGLGEHFDRLDGRGLIRDMQIQLNTDSESGVNEVHVSVHMMLSTRRYGLFLDDRAPAAFDLGSTHADALRVTTASKDAAFHFFARAEPLELLETYADIAGHPAMVPHWALAPQWWRNVSDRDEVLDDARRSREQGYPASVLWIDRPWSSYYHNWRFNDVLYPEAESMFDELETLGYRVLLHHSPQLSPPGTTDLPQEDASEGLFDRFKEEDWLVKTERGMVLQLPWGGGSGAFVDFSHPGAVEEVTRQIQRVTSLGAIGTKMDWDEYLQPNLGDRRLALAFHNGETNLTMRQWYSALYHKTVIEAFDAHMGQASFHVSRSGVHRDQVWNTCIWPGDLDNDFSEHTRGPSSMQEEWNTGGLPAAVVANQSLGMSGYPCFASDIGGYRGGKASEEVLLRWVPFGVFNGVMQLGGSSEPHMPWAVDTPYSSQLAEVTATYFRLRMNLVPYIYQQFVDAHRTGRPVVRALWLHHPDDPMARTYERDFYFGPDFLVAPVYRAGVTERTHYVPAGEFVDLWTGEPITGPAERTTPAPLGSMPILVRRGAIVPMAASDVDTMWPTADPEIVSYDARSLVRIYVVPAAGASARFYNGVAVDVAADGVSLRVTTTEADPGLDPAMAFVPDTVAVDLVLPAEPADVKVDGTRCIDCWTWVPERRILRIHPRATPIEVSF